MPYKRRFEWTGESLADDVDSSGGGGGGGGGRSGAGEDLYWKVVGTGAIAKSVGVGEGDDGDVTLRIQCTGSRTGGMAPHKMVKFDTFSSRTEYPRSISAFYQRRWQIRSPG